MNILLDLVFKITAISATPAASTAFLKQVCVVVDPKDGGVTPGVITECTTSSQIAALTNNTEALQLLNAGMSRVFILPMNNLDLSDALEGHESDFYTVLISSDFTDAEITATAASGNITITSYANLVSGTDDTVTVAGVVFTAQTGAAVLGEATFQAATDNNTTATSLTAQINAHATTSALVLATRVGAIVTITALEAGASGNALTLGYTDNDTNVGATKSGTVLSGGDGLFLGQFEGVVGISSTDDSFLDALTSEQYCTFHTTSGNKAKNMFYAFGKLLSATSWKNQQYITMPFADDVDTKGEADILFEDRISHVVADSEYGNRLALFAVGQKAIVAPYIKKNLNIDLQSKALQYISGNQPQYTITEASLLEDELQKVMDGYVSRKLITSGTVSVTLVNENFVANAEMVVPDPTALWRIDGEMSNI